MDAFALTTEHSSAVGDISISVVCPMFNEGKEIGGAVSKLKECLDGLPYRAEVLLVNDGSADDTVTQALSAVRGDPRFRVLSHRVNFGRGRALQTGFQEARGAIIVTTEGDLSWGKDVVGRLVEALRENPALDAVFASPHLPGGGYRNVPWHRVLLSAGGNRLLRFLYLGHLTMTTGMTRAYRSDVIQPHRFLEDGKEIHLAIAHRLLSLGHRIGEVPAVLSWPERDGARTRARRTNWPTIRRLVASHLAFGLFRGISRVIIPGIGSLTLLVAFFSGWSFWNYAHGAPSIYLVTLTGVLLILWVNLILGYFLLFHSLKIEIEVWKNESLIGHLLRVQRQPLGPRTYYEEIPVH
jgi:dolichol-phosphate mannosyltransferase